MKEAALGIVNDRGWYHPGDCTALLLRGLAPILTGRILCRLDALEEAFKPLLPVSHSMKFPTHRSVFLQLGSQGSLSQQH